MSKESKLIINKHYRNASSITEDVFSKTKNYDQESPELFREGEIVISNEEANPGIFIYTADKNVVAGPNGKIINVTSPEYINLTSGYTKSSEETPVISSGDSVEKAIGKLERLTEKSEEHIASVETQVQTVLESIVEIDADLRETETRLNEAISAESRDRAEKDEELETLISANAESILELSGATSKEAMDTFVVDNFEGGYDYSTREIKLDYKLGDGTVRHTIMSVDVTDFTTQVDFLYSAYCETIETEGGVDYKGQHYNQHDVVLKLVFIVTDSGQHHLDEVWVNVTELIGQHVVLTEEEYEALPIEQKNNGFFYYTYEED